MKYIRSSIIYLIIFALITSITKANPSQNIDKIPTVQAASQEIPEWNIQCLNAENSYEESRNLKKIKVALLDSGLDYDPDIPFAERADFLGADDLSAIFQDYTGHGTSVASLICADKNDDSITGIAANVELYSARILDENNQAPVSRVIDAVKWAMKKKVNIIHMSFGTKRYSKELHDIVRQAYNQGILIIAPAGNDGTAQEDESTVEYPAAFPCVIAVGATNTSNVKTELSSSGKEMDLVAPGEQILSAGSFGGVIIAEGTSMAAAQVTGIAAVLWGKYPDKSNQFIRELLLNSANKTVVSEDCQNGLADYAQSEQNYKKMNSVYHTFKKMGRSEADAVSNAGKWISGDTKKVDTHTEVNYVNGAWIDKDHSSLVTDAENNLPKEKKYKEISTYIKIIKKGAVDPDTIKATKMLSVHPSFHGGGNFIANTEYLLYAAKEYLNSKNNIKISLPEYSSVFGTAEPIKDEKKTKPDGTVTYSVKTDLKKAQKSLFKKILGSDETKWTNTKKGYALLGVTIHNATDAFSHRAYKKITNSDYGEGYIKVVHPSSEIKNPKAKENGITAIWENFANDPKNPKSKYFEYLLTTFAIADKRNGGDSSSTDTSNNGPGDLEPLYVMAGYFVKNLLYSFRSSQSFDSFEYAFSTYYHRDDISYFCLENVNKYWRNSIADAKRKEQKFLINYTRPKIKEPENLKVSAKNKTLHVKFNFRKNYTYVVAFEKKSSSKQKRNYFTQNRKDFSIPLKKVKYTNLVIYSFHSGLQKRYVVDPGEYCCKIIFDKKKIYPVTNKLKAINLLPGKTKKITVKYKCKNGFKQKGWIRKGQKKLIKKIVFEKPGQIILYPTFKKKNNIRKSKSRKK